MRLAALRMEVPRDSHSAERFSLRCAGGRVIFPAAAKAVASMREDAGVPAGSSEQEFQTAFVSGPGSAAYVGKEWPPPADVPFYAQFSHRPEDGAGAAALQLAAPRLLWQLAQPHTAGSTPGDLISSRPGLSTAAADGAAPAQPAKPRLGGSVDRSTERPDMQQYPRAAAAHTAKGFTRLVWHGGDLAAQLTLAPLRVQARAHVICPAFLGAIRTDT